MDSASEAKLREVAPELAARVRAMAATLAARGITIRVVSGLRSTAQQAVLYANRASNPRPVAVPGTSKHETGNAVDLSVAGGTWAQVGAAGEAQGLRWGGRFEHKDYPHFEVASGAVVSDAGSIFDFESDNEPFVVAGSLCCWSH
jgi:peptidoglycan L-alanyl-D-glutamate endopeptidase CwlK